MIPTLDTLQRKVYDVIDSKVHLALTQRLPNEFKMLVFEQAMIAESMPLDPRIFVLAQHSMTGRMKRWTRLLCEHRVLEMRYEDPHLRAADHYLFVLGFEPGWKECIPISPYYDRLARRKENETCYYHDMLRQ